MNFVLMFTLFQKVLSPPHSGTLVMGSRACSPVKIVGLEVRRRGGGGDVKKRWR